MISATLSLYLTRNVCISSPYQATQKSLNGLHQIKDLMFCHCLTETSKHEGISSTTQNSKLTKHLTKKARKPRTFFICLLCRVRLFTFMFNTKKGFFFYGTLRKDNVNFDLTLFVHPIYFNTRFKEFYLRNQSNCDESEI